MNREKKYIAHRTVLRKRKQLQRYEFKQLQKRKEKGTQGTQAHDCPTRLDDLLVGNSTSKIPHQVAHTVHAVVDEGEGHNGLEADLGEERKSGKSGGHGSGLEVPAQQRRDQVCG